MHSMDSIYEESTTLRPDMALLELTAIEMLYKRITAVTALVSATKVLINYQHIS